jgi:hypothetical protein
MDISFLFPRRVVSAIAGLEEAKNPAGKVLRLIQILLTPPSFEKISPICQVNSPQPRIADSNSRNAVSFSSARTTNRFPSSRCASTIQIVRPSESWAKTRPQLQPALGIVDHLLRRFARFKLGADFLDF